MPPVYLLRHVSVYSCYYTSQICKHFVDGECYENYTSLYNASSCDTVLGGYFLNDRCYYVPQNCSAGYYHQCGACYLNRASTYTNSTCYNIGGFHTGGYCYYVEFNCNNGYAENEQCYTRVNTLIIVVTQLKSCYFYRAMLCLARIMLSTDVCPSAFVRPSTRLSVCETLVFCRNG